MGKSISKYYIDLKEEIFQIPQNTADVTLWNYPATISDGTILGTIAVSSSGEDLVGELSAKKRGRYFFYNVPSDADYTVVVSGGGISTFIPDGLDKVEISFTTHTTGTDIPWKDGDTTSIAWQIQYIKDYLGI